MVHNTAAEIRTFGEVIPSYAIRYLPDKLANYIRRYVYCFLVLP